MQRELKSIWLKFFKFDWKFGLFLLLLVCVPRFFLVLQANQTGNYAPIGAIMFISALIPFLFLSKYGRKKVGIRSAKAITQVFLALLYGILASLVLYWIGEVLYANSYENWYLYIGKSYNIPEAITPSDKQTLFFIMAFTGMIFSPIGEELFFRGIVHASFAKSVGENKASLIDSTAFALTHIAHFGLVFLDQNWRFFFLPTLLWVIAMFLVSILFFTMKQKSDSLIGAVVCHSGFNLGMIYSIFYLL